jgi:hypothetical protein
MSETEAQQHRYQVFETRDGFLVDGGPGRAPVRVTHRATCWQVEGSSQQLRFGLFQVSGVADAAARLALGAWQPRADSRAPTFRIRDWAVQRAARAMAHLTAEQSRRLLPRTDSAVLGVQRAIFAATFGAGALALDERFYRLAAPFVISDVCCYRAAAIGVRNLGEAGCSLSVGWHEPGCAGRERGRCTCTVSVEQAVERLKDWRGLFSPTGHAYTSLNRTLMNLPGGVPHHVVCNLAGITLERPVTDRVEFTVVALGASDSRRVNRQVFLRAERGQIERALRRVGAAIRTPLDSRRTRDLITLVHYLADYPEAHTGNLGGLAHQAIRWHRDQPLRQLKELVELYGGDQPVAQPPIPLPTRPGIRFLGRIREICLEGGEMRHCIATYAGEALAGQCFLFHIERRGEVASAAVDLCGRVRQAYGPGNCRNAAARWGERVLREWGRGFPAPAASSVEDDGIPF